MKYFIKWLVLSSALISTSGSAQSYLCIEQAVTGFDAGENWQQTNYKAERKFIFRPFSKDDVRAFLAENEFSNLLNPYTDYRYIVTKLGSNAVIATCEKQPWHETNDKAIKDNPLKYYSSCNGFINFEIDTKKLRFVMFNAGHYTDNKSTGENTYIGIGECSKI